jgi:DNA-binding PadR family transcriptional regulator
MAKILSFNRDSEKSQISVRSLLLTEIMTMKAVSATSSTVSLVTKCDEQISWAIYRAFSKFKIEIVKQLNLLTKYFIKYMTSQNSEQLNAQQDTPKMVNTFRESISKLENEVLTCVSKQDRYGIEIVKVFEKASFGERTIGLSTLYTVLSRLEERELVKSKMEADRLKGRKGGAKRKYFSITDKGLKQLYEQETFAKRVAEYQLPELQPF